MNAFIVFAKEPKPGQVKTRLTPPLAAEQAVTLYTAFVEDVMATLAEVASPEAGDRLVLAAPGGPGPVLSALAGRHGFETAVQEGADLGARMKHAIGAELGRGAKKVLLVGSDSPTLPAQYVEDALVLLSDMGGETPDAVLGPAGDGGYWLIAARERVPDLFEGVPWSTRDVLAASLARARNTKTALALLPFWYDVDDVFDLRMLAAHLDALETGGLAPAPRTAAAIAALRASNPGFFLASPGSSTR